MTSLGEVLHPSMGPAWQKSMLRRCYQMASTSPDPSTQNYAIVLGTNLKVIGEGTNEFTKGMRVRSDMLEAPLKYAYIEHAERNALYHALRTSRATPWLMVCPWASCADCARAIIQSGVRVLIRHDHSHDGGWAESIAIGDEMMKAAGVHIITVEGLLGACDPVLRNGKTLHP